MAEHDQGTRSDPETWVTELTGHMGDTFEPNGFSSGSSTRVSRSQVLNSGRVASSLVVGFSGRISVYLLRGRVVLPSAGRRLC
jgi:hypothetical protein